MNHSDFSPNGMYYKPTLKRVVLRGFFAGQFLGVPQDFLMRNHLSNSDLLQCCDGAPVLRVFLVRLFLGMRRGLGVLRDGAGLQEMGLGAARASSVNATKTKKCTSSKLN